MDVISTLIRTDITLHDLAIEMKMEMEIEPQEYYTETSNLVDSQQEALNTLDEHQRTTDSIIERTTPTPEPWVVHGLILKSCTLAELAKSYEHNAAFSNL